MRETRSPGSLYAELGEALYQRQRHKEALEALQKALTEKELDVPIAEVYITLGRTYKALEKNNEALNALSQAVQQDINVFDRVADEFFEIQVTLQKSADSGTFLSKTLSRFFPSTTQASLRTLARDLMEKGKITQAENMLRNLLRLSPEDAEAHELLGTALLKQGKPQASQAEFQKAINIDDQRAASHRGLGAAFNQLQQYPEAVAAFTRALELAPQDLDSLLGRGVAYRHLENYAASERDLQRGRAYQPEHLDLARELAKTMQVQGKLLEATRALTEAAQLLNKNQDFHLARDLSREAIEMDADCGPAYQELGRALIGLDSYREGMQALEKAAGLIQNLDSYLLVAQTYYDHEDFASAFEILDKALQIEPRSTAALTLQARALIGVNSWDEALSSVEKALQTDPADVEALVVKGEILEASGDLEEAISVYEQARDHNPAHPVTNARLGMLYLANNRNQEALEALDRSLEIQPDADLYAAKGQVLYNLNDFEAAITALDQALELVPENADAARLKGSCLRLLNRSEEAVPVLQLAIDLDAAQDRDPDAWTYAELGEALRALGRPQESATAFKKAIRYRENYDWALARYGETLRSLEKNDEAIKVLEQAVEIADSNSFAWASLGAAYLEAGRYRSGLQAFDHAIEIENGNYFFALAWKGNLLRVNARYQEAIETFDLALNIDKNSWVLGEKAYAIRRQGKEGFEPAIPLLEEVLELEPDYGWAIGQLGICYYSLGRYEEALYALEKAIQLDETLTWVHPINSLVLEALGREAQAEQARAMALADPDNPQAYIDRGNIYEEVGAFEHAIRDYKHALEDEPMVASNALAWLYADAMNDHLEEATELAKKALELAQQGDNPDARAGTLDTLGWVYFKRGMYPEALPLLEEAAHINPEDLEVADHLSLCQAALAQG